jgi:PTEN phosphatase family protein
MSLALAAAALTTEAATLLELDFEGRNVKSRLTATALSNLALRIIAQIVKSARLLNICRVMHSAVLKRMVGLGKSRFVKRGFDLDLTYITPRVIAMSLPSSGKTSIFRNAM